MITLPSLPDKFNKDEKSHAELWGALTDRFPVGNAHIANIKDETSYPDGFTLKTKAEISDLIGQAMKQEDQRTAKILFEITKPIEQRQDYTRKSLRIGQGEYLDFLYLKILKDTSFSSILIDVLTPSMLEYVEKLNSDYGEYLSDRIENLREKLLNWREIVPEARSRIIQLNYIKADERYFYFNGDAQQFLENIKDAIKTIGYLENLPSDIYVGPDPVYADFQDEWNKRIDEEFKSGVYVEPYIDKEVPKKLSFRLYTVPYTRVDLTRMEELYQKNEYGIDEYIEKYCLGKNEEYIKKMLDKYRGSVNKFSYIVDQFQYLNLGYEVTVGKYYVDVENKTDYEIKINENFLGYLENLLTKSEKDILDEVQYYEYTSFDDLIHKVMMNGNEAEYGLVSQLFTISGALQKIRRILANGLMLIKNEIAKYPVMSYYVPHALSPLSSIVFKENNLHDLIRNMKKST